MPITTKEERVKHYKDAISLLESRKIESSHDSYIFIAAIADDNKETMLLGSSQGTENALFQALYGTSKLMPDAIKKALLITAANILADTDKAGRMIGRAVGFWAEEKYGMIHCECDRCLAEKN